MIVIDTSGVKPLLAQLQAASKNFPRDARRALTSVRRATNTEVSRAITESYTVPKRVLGSALRASNVDTATLSFTITGSRAPIGLHHFDHLASPMFGVSVRVQKDGGAGRLPGAFKLNVANFGGGGGSTGRIFIRAQRNGKRVARLPIKALFGPSAADMMINPKVSDRIVAFAATKLSAEIERLVRVALDG